ncbi:MAG TPA: phage terminase small subunit P27 family [Burkholderiales bacterium]|nr:phage terminase small subunit P27 family [Burkholderiales bacterium]
MAKPGPRPLPQNVHLLKGNPSKKSMASLLDDVVRPDVAIPPCPKELSKDARAEWGRIAPHLAALGLISEIDRAALAAYCSAWGTFIWAERRIAAFNKEKQDKTGEAALIWDTPSGYKQMSVTLQIRNRSMEQMKGFLAEFGMSPAARSRVTQSDPRGVGQQNELPGMEAPKEGGWGDFT